MHSIIHSKLIAEFENNLKTNTQNEKREKETNEMKNNENENISLSFKSIIAKYSNKINDMC